MLEKKQIDTIQKWITNNDTHVRKQSRLCSILSNPTRIKILLLLKEYEELCVTDIAESLHMTLSAVSHQLRTLENNGLVQKERKGLTICYYPKKESLTLI